MIVASPTDHITTTDAAGHYSISDVRTQVLQVFKDGYFTTGKVITTITQDTQVDFSMDPWEFIALGEVVRRTNQAWGHDVWRSERTLSQVCTQRPGGWHTRRRARLSVSRDVQPAALPGRRLEKLGPAPRDAAGGRVRPAAGHEFPHAAVDPRATRGDVSNPSPQLRRPRPRVRAADATALTRER